MIHEDKPTLEDALEHFGVKGMRWGVRNAARKVIVGEPDASGVTRRDKRVAYRSSARTRDRAIEDFHYQPGKLRDRDIKAAREGLRQANRDYSDTRREIKSRREEAGKNATKIALREAKNKNYVINHKAQQDTRAEFAVKTAINVGLAVAGHMADKKAAEEDSAA